MLKNVNSKPSLMDAPQEPVDISTGFSDIPGITLELILSFCNGIELAKVAQTSKELEQKAYGVASQLCIIRSVELSHARNVCPRICP